MNRLLCRRLTVSLFWSLVYLGLLSYVAYLNFSTDVDAAITNKIIVDLSDKNATDAAKE